jgi:hypothetical protein
MITVFLDNRHMKVARLSAIHTVRLIPQEIFLVLWSVMDWVDPSVDTVVQGKKSEVLISIKEYRSEIKL